MPIDSIKSFKIKKLSPQAVESVMDNCAIEEPLQISISVPSKNPPLLRKNIAVTMRTPGDDKELALGFLFTEGLISTADQIDFVKIDTNKINISLNSIEKNTLLNLDRNFYTTSSCGVCGKASIDAIKTTCKLKVENIHFQISSKTIESLPSILLNKQESFKSTGGIHAAALFDLNGQLINLKEDVGRHNALDKLIGSHFISKQLPLNKQILLLSGRTSFELVQKAIMAGIRFIASVGAPSSLAVELCQEYDITLIGFLKKNRFNIYHGDKRVLI